MPKIVMERFSARLVTDDGRLVAAAERVDQDGMFLVFLTIPSSYNAGQKIVDREMVAACKNVSYCTSVMRACLEAWYSQAQTQQYVDRFVLGKAQITRMKALPAPGQAEA